MPKGKGKGKSSPTSKKPSKSALKPKVAKPKLQPTEQLKVAMNKLTNQDQGARE